MICWLGDEIVGRGQREEEGLLEDSKTKAC